MKERLILAISKEGYDHLKEEAKDDGMSFFHLAYMSLAKEYNGEVHVEWDYKGCVRDLYQWILRASRPYPIQLMEFSDKTINDIHGVNRRGSFGNNEDAKRLAIRYPYTGDGTEHPSFRSQYNHVWG